MSNITRAAGIIRHMVKIENPTHDQDIAQELADAGLLAPAPQVIRTVAELEAEDPDTVIWPARHYGPCTVGTIAPDPFNPDWTPPLPAVVVASGEHVRACREALEGETP